MSSIQVQKVHRLTGHEGAIYALAPGPSPELFYSVGGDGWIVRWDLRDPELGKLVAKVSGNIFSTAYLPDEQLILAGDMYGGLHWLDLSQPDQHQGIAHHKKGIFGIRKIGEDLLTLGGEGILTRWSINQRRTVESLQLSHQSLRGMDYSPEFEELAIAASDACIYLIDAKDWTVRQIIQQAHEPSVFTVKYAEAGQTLLSGGRDAHLAIWQREAMPSAGRGEAPISTSTVFTQKIKVPAHMYTLNHIAIHPSGDLFATASRDKTIKFWSTKTGELLKVIDTIRDHGHVNSVNHLYWTDYNNYLISASDDRSLGVWSCD